MPATSQHDASKIATRRQRRSARAMQATGPLREHIAGGRPSRRTATEGVGGGVDRKLSRRPETNPAPATSRSVCLSLGQEVEIRPVRIGIAIFLAQTKEFR
jgi:hypothetical protein